MKFSLSAARKSRPYSFMISEAFAEFRKGHPERGFEMRGGREILRFLANTLLVVSQKRCEIGLR